MPIYLATIFLSAFLLFQVQPIIARYILPWYGGTPAVWTTCMLCFQVGLLAGYTYAHGLASRFRSNPKRQTQVHLILILFSLLWLPITPDESMKPSADSSPTIGIVILLLKTIGLPFIIISASGPLMQHWFAQSFPKRSPYRLYAISNVGSLLGLLTYPFFVEPNWGLRMQTYIWSTNYLVYGLLVVVCSWVLRRIISSEESKPGPLRAKLDGSKRHRFFWIAFSATGSIVLLATTNQICQDIAVAPFMWVLPLALYLISFILCFDHSRWYQRWLWIPAGVLSIAITIFLLLQDFNFQRFNMPQELGIYCATIFTCCMLCHGELVRLKPAANQLTGFYLYVSLGGALGGVFVSLIAPQIFSNTWELHISLLLVVLLVFWRVVQDIVRSGRFSRFWLSYGIGISLMALGIMAGALWLHIQRTLGKGAVAYVRNFYGILSVYEEPSTKFDRIRSRTLLHGRISHGHELLRYDGKRMIPAGYFSPQSGAGLAMKYHPKRRTYPRQPIHIGIIGLGIGTLAGYAEHGDTVRCYEINPAIEPLAREHFHYLKECPAKLEVINGDGRISLEHELHDPEQAPFDILFLDAFAGDAIPVHLLTREAFELYEQHLAADGVLAIHITNRYVDLRAPIRALAKHFEYHCTFVERKADYTDENYSMWAILSRRDKTIQYIKTAESGAPETAPPATNTLWTDDYSNLIDVLIW